MSLSTSSSDADARKFFLSAVGIAAVFLLLALFLSEWLLRTHVIPQDVFFQQYKIYQNTPSAKYVGFGDSHMSQGFAAPSGSLNMGLSGEGFDQIAAKVEAYLEKKPPPEGIILQIAPHMFADYRFHSPQRDYDSFFNQAFSLQPRLHIADPVLRKQLSNFWKVYFTYGTFQSAGNVTSEGAYLIDHTMKMPETPQEKQEVKRRQREHTPSRDFLKYRTEERMKEIIQKIKSRGIPLCVVSFPVSPLYRSGFFDNKTYKDAQALIFKITDPEGVPYHDYTNLYDDYALYRNLDHLNKTGAELFTPKLIHDCFQRD